MGFASRDSYSGYARCFILAQVVVFAKLAFSFRRFGSAGLSIAADTGYSSMPSLVTKEVEFAKYAITAIKFSSTLANFRFESVESQVEQELSFVQAETQSPKVSTLTSSLLLWELDREGHLSLRLGFGFESLSKELLVGLNPLQVVLPKLCSQGLGSNLRLILAVYLKQLPIILS